MKRLIYLANSPVKMRDEVFVPGLAPAKLKVVGCDDKGKYCCGATI